MLAELIGVALRFFAETFEQQPAEMFGRQNLRPLRVDFSIANADLIDAVHQFGNEIEIETGIAESGDALLRGHDHLGVFDCVIEIVFSHWRCIKGTGSTSSCKW